MNFSSKLIEEAVNAFSALPGIGKKSALRHVLHILQMEENNVTEITSAINRLKSEIQFCKVCHNISDQDTCTICLNQSRDKSIICVVENIRDLMAIENTQHFNGVYHVLGGLISPWKILNWSIVDILKVDDECGLETYCEEYNQDKMMN